MRFLPKLLFILFVLLFLNLFQIKSVLAEDAIPVPYVACDSDSGSGQEYHSLRPYQKSPCNQSKDSLAAFCGNELSVNKTLTGTAYPGDPNCTDIGGGQISCHFKKTSPETITTIAVKLENAYFPIMGNTETGVNANNDKDPDDGFTDADKVNEYVSWYLNGVPYKKEYPENFSIEFAGPIAKLYPQELQLEERVKTIERGDTKDDDLDQSGKALTQDRHNQVVVCTKEIEIPILGIKIGSAKTTECGSFFGGSDYRISEWNGDLSLFNKIESEIIDILAKLLPNILPGDIKNFFEAEKPWNQRVPPLSWNFKDPLLYKKAYNEWRGKSCLLVPTPVRFLVCIEESLK